MFEQIIGISKYINPVNSKSLEQMKNKSVKAGDIYLKANDAAKSQKIDQGVMGLYREYIQQLNDDLLERADSFIDTEKKSKNNEANYLAQQS